MKRRDFTLQSLQWSIFSFVATKIGYRSFQLKEIEDIDLEEITIAHIRALLDQGQCTIESLTEQYLSRITEIDKNGPNINSIISRKLRII